MLDENRDYRVVIKVLLIFSGALILVGKAGLAGVLAIAAIWVGIFLDDLVEVYKEYTEKPENKDP